MPETIIEFYPTPYGVENADQGKCWHNIRQLLGTLQSVGEVKALYTGVRGPDCYFSVQAESEAIKAALEGNELVTNVSTGPIDIHIVNEHYDKGLLVQVPLALIQSRKRR